jgi:predicted regulator of Ras-like GTPase activity (Roadblock/LC7/MglB family)/cytochrome c-type biogenesis protein CcmH/NrfG
MAREEAEIKELSKKLAQNPDSMVFVQLADAHRRAGDLEQSVQVCQQGLERHPTYTTARAILGRNFLDLGRLDEAEAEFRKIEVADPENIMAHRMLGQISMQKGLYAEAISRQQRVLSLDPEDSTAQELLQEALAKSKEAPAGASPAPAPKAEAPKAASASDQSGTIKVAEIYIKKGAFDEAAEVLQEVLASDPDNALARQKLQEVNERRGKAAGAAAAEDGARQKAEADAKRKADEEAAAKRAADEAKAQAENAAKQKAADEAKARAEAQAKADQEAKQQAEAAAKKKTEEEAKARAEADARSQAEAKAKADQDAREQEARDRKASKLSSDDILSVMTASSDDLIGEPSEAPEKPAAAPAPAAASPEASKAIEDFLRAQAMEASLLLDLKGKVLESKVSGDAAALGATAGAIFSNTEKAAQRMAFGALKQIMIVGEDGRQILFVALKAGVLVALTGRNTNLGLLRVAVNDLVKRA